MNFLEAIFNYIKDIYTERLPYFPSNIRISLLVILFCTIAVIELYTFITFRRIYQNNQEKKARCWQEHIDNMLANLIIFNDSDDADEIAEHFYPRLKKLPLNNTIVSNILVNQILTYHKNFTGRTRKVLSILYRMLNLDKKPKKNITNKNWEVKIEAIREAAEMGLKEMTGQIIKYTDDENALLRMEAQTAYIKFSKKDPFRFLDRAQEQILDWHQVVLFEIITKNKNLVIPSFSKWLRSPNDTVIMLCLKLIEHFMQFDAAEEVQLLLKHHNPQIVKKSVEIIGKLELESAEKHMFEIYFDHSEEIKLEILNSLGKISSGNYDDFLASRIYSSNPKIKLAALYAIRKNPKDGKLKLQDIYNQATVENKAVIKHVLDSRIKQ